MESEVASHIPSVRSCGCGLGGAEFDLRVLRGVENGGPEHRPLHLSAFIFIELRVENLELAGFDSELDGSRFLVNASGGYGRRDLVFVAGEGEDSGLVHVDGDLGESGVDGPRLCLTQAAGEQQE